MENQKQAFSRWEKESEKVKLLPGEAMDRRERNTRYLLELKTQNLLFHYYQQAGLNGSIASLEGMHGGWDSVTSQIRGTLTGHWLSAAALTSAETGNQELKGKADYIAAEIRRCQEANGGEWAFPIPPSYITGVREGRSYWAPVYVCHKVLMGLLDMYLYAGNQTAMEVIRGCYPWFRKFREETPLEQLWDMMERQETGGMMEFWADLYGATGEPEYLEMMRYFERPALLEPLLEDRDVLTNMHANTTVPEIHGAARAYEVTGEERYRTMVENYWKWAVTRRGMFATGGQTSGEVWTPPMRQAARLGDKNQEHCVVYNMIRLADYLFRWTGEREYLDYIERNIYNGLFAQGHVDCGEEEGGLIAYYLPLRAGGKKAWGSRTQDFWCCHCTLLQANARLREFLYYRREKELVIGQYFPSEFQGELGGASVTLSQTLTDLAGNCNRINETALTIWDRPNRFSVEFEVRAEEAAEFTLCFRIPWWVKGEFLCLVNGEKVEWERQGGFARVTRLWKEDRVTVSMGKGLTCWPLADEPDTVAFLDGPVVLAGLVGEERTLYGEKEYPEEILRPSDERLWGTWQQGYKTVHQPVNFFLKPLYQIGTETYTVYFPVESRRK